MSWHDLGVIFAVNHQSDWMQSHCYAPVAFDMMDRIRVYGSFWDANKYGRLGYIDVDAHDPMKILGYSQTPCMPDSAKGTFDGDGVTPLSVSRDTDTGLVRLYYVGWHTNPNDETRYTLFTSVAFSDDNGQTFTRYSDTPIMGANFDGCEVRTGYIAKYADVWRFWGTEYAGPIMLHGQRTPSYHLATATSPDGLVWPDEATMIYPVNDTVFGYGRSAIWQEDGLYHGLFSIRHIEHGYRDMLYATSPDGTVWGNLRADGYAFSASGTKDHQSLAAFPSLAHRDDKIIMFYNGDGYGAAGLRAAVWVK